MLNDMAVMAPPNAAAPAMGFPPLPTIEQTQTKNDAAPQNAQIAKQFKARIDRSKRKRQDLAKDWRINVDYRRGKQFDTESDTDRVAVTIDWAQTKAKQAQLFSQVPQVMLTPKHPAFGFAVPKFAQKLNDELTRAKVGVTIDECMPDVINAAGVAFALVGYECRFVHKEVSSVDPLLMPPDAMEAVAQQAELKAQVPLPIEKRFFVRRVSPQDGLWPVEFRGSDFDQSPWLGYTGALAWSVAKTEFKLTDDDKRQCVGGNPEERPLSDNDEAMQADSENEVVRYDEIYYWRYLYDPACESFNEIWRIVYLKGKSEPVIHERWKGQAKAANGKGFVGAMKFPLRVLTLTYISDEAVPPSDSAIGRPQVDELIKSRSQRIQQRTSSLPMRWFDVNRVDPNIIDALMKGTFQGMIPTNGDGTRAIGEVARAAYPREDFDFDKVAKGELQEAWQIGPNQVGAFNGGERSASEAQIVQENFSTRIGYERAKCGAWFCGIAEVFAGLLALYGDFDTPDLGPDAAERLQGWDRASIAGQFVYTVRADSTVLLDSNQRLAKLNQFLNMTGKSGWVNVEPILREIAELSGLDPELVIQKPNPKGPDAPSIGYHFSAIDLVNPIALSILMKAGQAPTPQELQAANALLQAAGIQGTVIAPNGMQGDAMGNPAAAAAVLNPAVTGSSAPLPMKAPAPPMEDAAPHWNMLDRINMRRNDGSAQ